LTYLFFSEANQDSVAQTLNHHEQFAQIVGAQEIEKQNQFFGEIAPVLFWMFDY